MDTDHGFAWVDPTNDDVAQIRTLTPAPSSPADQTNQGGKRSVQPASQPEQSKRNTSFGVKRDARAVELPDEDEPGGKFQQVEGLTTVDAEEIPCEFSVGGSLLLAPQKWVKRYHARGGRVENPWWMLKKQLCGSCLLYTSPSPRD